MSVEVQNVSGGVVGPNRHERQRRRVLNQQTHQPISPPRLHSARKPTKSRMDKFREVLADKLGSENALIRSLLAEFIGTFFLLLIGISANIQQSITGASETSAQLAWGFGFAFAVYLSASVSGGHLNPAISISSSIIGDLSVGRLIVYIVTQLLGAFVGSAAAYLGHIDDINYLDNGERSILGENATASLFATFPSGHISILGSLIVGTAILALCIALITDKRHQIPTGLVPLLAGFSMSMISMTYGANGGFAINPARDLGPRLFLLCVGYGWTLFTVRNYYFWIPIVGPIIGAILGTWIYKIFVGIHGASDEIDITTNNKIFYSRGDNGYKRHLSNENENREPTPLSWRKMTVPEFPNGHKSLEVSQLPISTYIPQNQQRYQQDQPVYSTLVPPKQEQASLRREPEPSPPPPLPSTQPPPINQQQSERNFVDELKQRNNNNRQGQSEQTALNRNQEEQSLTLFAEPDVVSKQNGPIKSEKLFSELFTPPITSKRRIYPKDEEENYQPTAPPRRFQTDRPDISDKITVSLAYYHHDDNNNERPKVYI